MGEAKRRERTLYGEREIVFQPDDSRMVIKDSQDVEPVLAAVARHQDLKRNTGDNKYLGTLPAVIVVDLMNRGIFHDPDAFDRWWNSTEANPWRVWKGTV